MFRKIKAQLLALECRVDQLSALCYELKMQLDELRADAEGREAAEKAERAFTEGVANILNYEIGGKK